MSSIDSSESMWWKRMSKSSMSILTSKTTIVGLSILVALGGGILGGMYIQRPTVVEQASTNGYSNCYSNATAGLYTHDCRSVLNGGGLLPNIHTFDGKSEYEAPYIQSLPDVTLEVMDRTTIKGCESGNCKNWWNAVSQTEKHILTVAYNIPDFPVGAYLSVIDKETMKEVFNRKVGDRRAPFLHNNKAYGLDQIGIVFAPPGLDIRIWELDLDTLSFRHIGGEKGLNEFFKTKGGEFRYQSYGHQIGFLSKQDECGGYMFVSRGEIGYYDVLSFGLAASGTNRLTAPSATDYRGNIQCVCTTPNADGSLKRCPGVLGEGKWLNGDVEDYYEDGKTYTVDESFLNKERSDFTGAMDVIDCSGPAPTVPFTSVLADYYVSTVSSTANLTVGDVLTGSGLVQMEVVGIADATTAHLAFHEAHYNFPSSLPSLLSTSTGVNVSLVSVSQMHLDFILKDFNSTSNPTNVSAVNLTYGPSYATELVASACSTPTVKFTLLKKMGEGDTFDKQVAQSLYSQGSSIWAQVAIDEEVGIMYVPTGNAQLYSVDRFLASNALKKRIVAKWYEVIEANNRGTFEDLRKAAADMTAFNEEVDALRATLSSKDQLIESGIAAVNLTTGKTIWSRAQGGTDGYFAFLGSFDSQFDVFASVDYQDAAKAINYFDIDCNAMFLSDDRTNGFRSPIVGCKSGVYSKYTYRGTKLFSSQAGPPAVDLFRGAPNNYGSICMSGNTIVFSAAPEALQLQGLTFFNVTINPSGWLSPTGERIGWGVSMTTAIDSNTGEVLWVKSVSGATPSYFRTPSPNPTTDSRLDNPHKTMVPTCQGGKVFTLCTDDKMACVYDARTGFLLGTYEAFGARTDIFKDTNMLFDGAFAYSHNGGSDVYKYYVSA